MITRELSGLSTTNRDLRKFGLLVGGVFLLLGALTLWRHKAIGPWLATPGVILMSLGLIFPRSLKYVYLAWMSLAFALGVIVSTLLLSLFYYLAVTPLALVARLIGKDFLSLRFNANARSYWVRRDQAGQPANYQQQF